MKTAPSSAAMNAPTRSEERSAAASAVPTSTGATPAGSVRGRAASSQILTGEGRWEIASAMPSRPPRELGEVGLALGLVGLAPLLGLVGAVEEQVGVVGQLLD